MVPGNLVANMRNIGRDRKTARRQRTSKGNVFVETALIFIVFATMLIGVFDFGRPVHSSGIAERARYAARWGAINDPTDSTSISNMVLYYQSATPSSGTSSYFDLTSSNVSVTNPDSGTNDYRLNITISGYSYTMLSPFIGGSHTGPRITVSVPLGACRLISRKADPALSEGLTSWSLTPQVLRGHKDTEQTSGAALASRPARPQRRRAPETII